MYALLTTLGILAGYHDATLPGAARTAGWLGGLCDGRRCRDLHPLLRILPAVRPVRRLYWDRASTETDRPGCAPRSSPIWRSP